MDSRELLINCVCLTLKTRSHPIRRFVSVVVDLCFPASQACYSKVAESGLALVGLVAVEELRYWHHLNNKKTDFYLQLLSC